MVVKFRDLPQGTRAERRDRRNRQPDIALPLNREVPFDTPALDGTLVLVQTRRGLELGIITEDVETVTAGITRDGQDTVMHRTPDGNQYLLTDSAEINGAGITGQYRGRQVRVVSEASPASTRDRSRR